MPLAKPGDSISVSKQYLNLGDIRLIDNRWGSDNLGCSTTMSVAVNADSTFGWTFDRPTCGGMRADPDFPELEFGVAPFGTTSSLLTTPPFSSTTLLPIQLKNLSSASVTFNNFASTVSSTSDGSDYWDSNYEFWISNEDPTNNTNAGVYAEIIMFVGWESGRSNSSQGGWTCTVTGTNAQAATFGDFQYSLCHQSDDWSSGWRFFNFNVSTSNATGISPFTGKADVLAIINWITQHYSGFTGDMWLTRIEVGTEVDDDSQGSAKLNNITFEINGTSKSPTFAK